MKYKLAGGVEHLARGPWHLFFRPETLAWTVTDDIGAAILKALADSRDSEEIAMGIAAKAGFPLGEVILEVERFLESLAKEGIVEGPEKGHPSPAVCSTELKPDHLYLHLTARCNLSCTYCYNQPLRKQKSWEEDLPLPLAMQALHQARELGVKTVLLTGGEPLLHPYALEVAEAAHDLGFRTILLTNGLLVDDSVAERLARCCDQITVSLDSAAPALHDLHRGPGTHKRVAEAVRCLKAAGVKEVVISGVITRHNQHERYQDFERYAVEIGADRAVKQIYILQGDQRDPLLAPEFDSLLRDLEEALERAVGQGVEFWGGMDAIWRDRCGAAFGVIAIGSEGMVYPCQGLMKPEFKAGSLAESHLAEIYESSETLAKIRRITVADIHRCRNCPFRHLCGGGCRALAYNIYRSLIAPIPEEYCAFNRLLAEQKLWVAALHGRGTKEDDERDLLP
ncbi:MAG: radical SAM protein [Candidatus Bipolaricaulaceae bacterium]